MVILCEGLRATAEVACEDRLLLLSNDQSDDRSAVSLRDAWCRREWGAVRSAR
jgi:hypothetical protein